VKVLVLAFLLVAVAGPAQVKRAFTGTITDSMCPVGDHSRMRMGANDAECTIACVDAHGATFVLYDGKQVFALSDQKTSEKFAGKKVAVAGTLDAAGKTIQVDSIAAAK
jgi:hypothetical protein